MNIIYRIFLYSILACPVIGYAQDSTTNVLIKQIDFLQNRHEVLAKNIANISTPKYITQDLQKPDMLEKKEHKIRVPKVRLKLTNPHHIKPKKAENEKYTVVLDKASPMKPNKNNVDLATQVTRMAMNTDEVAEALKNYRTSIDLINTAADSGGGQ